MGMGGATGTGREKFSEVDIYSGRGVKLSCLTTGSETNYIVTLSGNVHTMAKEDFMKAIEPGAEFLSRYLGQNSKLGSDLVDAGLTIHAFGHILSAGRVAELEARLEGMIDEVTERG